MEFRFEWDPDKARANLAKHSISFAQAATVLLDPNQLTMYDEDHSDDETRWVTMGRDSAGAILVVVHTFREIRVNEAVIRVISARTATGREARQYLNQE